jgi:hypothetical protein
MHVKNTIKLIGKRPQKDKNKYWYVQQKKPNITIKVNQAFHKVIK